MEYFIVISSQKIYCWNDTLKLADFGSCRGIKSNQPFTEYISTGWYRAPECLLTDGYYTYKMDMWGVGCVMFEIMSLFPLFPGTNELDQIQKIHNILGTPSAELISKMRR
jgi:renal tumor antigen